MKLKLGRQTKSNSFSRLNRSPRHNFQLLAKEFKTKMVTINFIDKRAPLNHIPAKQVTIYDRDYQSAAAAADLNKDLRRRAKNLIL